MRLLAALILLSPIFIPLQAADDAVIISRFNKNTLIVNAPAFDKVPATLKNKLNGRVTVDFQDVDLVQAIETFQKLAGVNVVIGPKLRADNDRSITLKAKNMKSSSLVNWLKQLGDVHVSYMNEAIYFSQDKPTGERKIRLVDVSDLTMPLKSFPGPKMNIPNPGDEGGQLVDEIFEDDEAENDADDIIDILKDTLEREGVAVD